MSAIVVSEELSKQLRSLTGRVEVRDPAGNLLGAFEPQFDITTYVGRECPLSEEEIQRRTQDPRPRLSAAEVRALLVKK